MSDSGWRKALPAAVSELRHAERDGYYGECDDKFGLKDRTWDDQFLYVGFWGEELFVWAKYKLRDEPIYLDNKEMTWIAKGDGRLPAVLHDCD